MYLTQSFPSEKLVALRKTSYSVGEPFSETIIESLVSDAPNTIST